MSGKKMQDHMKQLRARPHAELRKELLELSRAQFSLRMQHGTQQLQNSSELRRVRREIARVQTVLGEQLVGEHAA